MRILILSDIHANWAALQAIQETWDICLFLGDLVDYGPDPAPCIEWIRQHAQHAVRGNHDHGLAQQVPVYGLNGFRYLTAATRGVTSIRVHPEQRRYLASLPVSRMLTLAGKRFLLVHATPRDPLDEYSQNDAEFWARRLPDVAADYVLVGHTHQQYSLQIDSTTIINPGSVGLQRDGDPRAGYAILEDGRLELKRIDYSIETVVQAVQNTPIPEVAQRMLIEVYRRGQLPPVLPQSIGERLSPRTPVS